MTTAGKHSKRNMTSISEASPLRSLRARPTSGKQPMSDHDSGCRMKWPLQPGLRGSAEFRGERREHRLLLDRHWGGELDLHSWPPGYAFWIGMNPSGAEADVDDLTIRKEMTWTRMLGLRSYVKANVGTYRWTDSTTLKDASIPVVHPENLEMIRQMAATAATVIFATGKPPEILLKAFAELRLALKGDGRQVKCLGTTKEGYPKHSSRIGYSTPFVDFVL